MLRQVLSTFAHRRYFATFPRMAEDEATEKLAVVKHVVDSEHLTFSFLLQDSRRNVRRQLNMHRPITEPASQFLDRINHNVAKIVDKKKHRKKLRVSEEQDGPSVEDVVPQAKFFRGDGEEIQFPGDKNVREVFLDKGSVGSEIFFHVLDNKFRVRVNPPLIESISLTDQVMAGFPVYPIKLNLLFGDVDHSIFEWYVSEQLVSDFKGKNIDVEKLRWLKRTSDGNFFFTPTTDDMGRLLRVLCIPRDGEGQEGVPSAAVSKAAVEAGPGFCPFENRHAFTTTSTPKEEVRTVTYNILADLYADSDFSRNVLHPQCPPYALAIPYRISLLIKELLGYNADVICLQEVDTKVFERDLAPVLSRYGLDGVFDRKGGQVSEGLACFWRRDKFEVVSEDQQGKLLLGEAIANDPQFADILMRVKDNADLLDALTSRTTALQTVLLKAKDYPEYRLLVANTHLYFKPDADHIRLIQSAMCLRHVENIRSEITSQADVMKCGLVFCGDFNSTPPFGVLQLVRSGLITKDHADWSSCKGQHVIDLELQHGLSLDSACGTPKYTNFTSGFADCLDYIFYDRDCFNVSEVVPFPTEEELGLHTAIPNIVFPSDHIACIASLRWREDLR